MTHELLYKDKYPCEHSRSKHHVWGAWKWRGSEHEEAFRGCRYCPTTQWISSASGSWTTKIMQVEVEQIPQVKDINTETGSVGPTNEASD